MQGEMPDRMQTYLHFKSKIPLKLSILLHCISVQFLESQERRLDHFIKKEKNLFQIYISKGIFFMYSTIFFPFKIKFSLPAVTNLEFWYLCKVSLLFRLGKSTVDNRNVCCFGMCFYGFSTFATVLLKFKQIFLLAGAAAEYLLPSWLC